MRSTLEKEAKEAVDAQAEGPRVSLRNTKELTLPSFLRISPQGLLHL